MKPSHAVLRTTPLILSILLIGVTCSQEPCTTPGALKSDGCDACICVRNAWSCHDACLDRPSRSVPVLPVGVDLKSTPCAPNDYFKLDCNTCYCNIDKSGYLCTQNLCPIAEQSSPNSTHSQANATRANATDSGGGLNHL